MQSWLRKIAIPADFYPRLFGTLEKYQGQALFVHFSDIPKIGINYKPSHRDPVGIYFFPIDYVLKNYSQNTSFVFKRYMFVCRVTPKALLDLGSVTEEQLNNLLQGMEMHRSSRTGAHPGADLWYSLERSIENKPGKYGWSFSKIFRDLGYDAIYDPGIGAIHTNEPNQLLALTPSIVEVLDMIDTRMPASSRNEQDYSKYPFYGQTNKPAIELVQAIFNQLGLNTIKVKSPKKDKTSYVTWNGTGADKNGNKMDISVHLVRGGEVNYSSFYATFGARWFSHGKEVDVSDLFDSNKSIPFDITSDYNTVVQPFTERVKQVMTQEPMDDFPATAQAGQQLARIFGGKYEQDNPIWGRVIKKIFRCEIRMLLQYVAANNKYEQNSEPVYKISGLIKVPKHSIYDTMDIYFGQHIPPIPEKDFVATVKVNMHKWIFDIMDQHFSGKGQFVGFNWQYLIQKMQPVLQWLEQIKLA